MIGAGLAGATLAWRLAQRGVEVELAAGPPQPADATAVSGGAVRAFETEPGQRALALASMAELLSDARLAGWAGYTECGSVYLPTAGDGLAPALAELESVLPGSASLRSAAELSAAGWAGLPPDAVAVAERRAGFVSPAGLRANLLADLRQRGITFLDGQIVERVWDGGLLLGGRRRDADVVVVAAGAWTPALLAGSGFDPDGLTTKGIQYTLHQADGVWPTAFVDDRSELFGRPVPGGVLIGLPTRRWGVATTAPEPDLALSARAAAVAGERFPSLRLHSSGTPITAVDCYAPDHLLALRGVSGRLFSFSGGSGGSVKTALAASDRAARVLAELPGPLTSHLEPERSVLSS
ncbi:MAG TPA: FAD-dependent oxidoreductase [Jatrophihabitans sp.]|nr:FAD-dependent oxidoreductase [Jatrophihabitans sp.]